jgi:large subunit ribosomal protein L37Ae
MVKEKSLKAGNKFGTRYGRRNRDKFTKLENEQRKLHKCPYCNMLKVKRLAAGIWFCKKCGAMFASKAYTVSKVQGVKEEEQVS